MPLFGFYIERFLFIVPFAVEIPRFHLGRGKLEIFLHEFWMQREIERLLKRYASYFENIYVHLGLN